MCVGCGGKWRGENLSSQPVGSLITMNSCMTRTVSPCKTCNLNVLQLYWPTLCKVCSCHIWTIHLCPPVLHFYYWNKFDWFYENKMRIYCVRGEDKFTSCAFYSTNITISASSSCFLCCGYWQTAHASSSDIFSVSRCWFSFILCKGTGNAMITVNAAEKGDEIINALKELFKSIKLDISL